MKKLVLSIALAISSVAVFAQKEKFEAIMTEQAAAIQANYEGSYMPMANKITPTLTNRLGFSPYLKTLIKYPIMIELYDIIETTPVYLHIITAPMRNH